jgi:hypothetical protein
VAKEQSRLPKWMDNRLIATLIAGAISSICLTIFGGWGAICRWIANVISTVWGWAVYPVGVPAALLVVLVVMAVTPIVAKIIASRKRGRPPERAEWWLDYRSDSFFGIKWHWDYVGIEHEITDPFAECPHDTTPLVWVSAPIRALGAALHCETCKTTFDDLYEKPKFLYEKVKRQIVRKINSGEWKDVVGVNDDGTIPN